MYGACCGCFSISVSRIRIARSTSIQGECPEMKNQVNKFLKDESGQDVAEYALLLVLIVIAIAIAAPGLTDVILSVFSRTRSVLGV